MKILCSSFILMLIMTGSTAAAPKAELWEYWLSHDPQSTMSVDHGNWNDFLSNYLVQGIDGINRLDYGSVTSSDRKALNNYLVRLGATSVTRLNRAEQKAFWINLYNTLTVQVVLEHYPVDSIRDINISPGIFSGLLGAGPWKKKLISIEGKDLSLDDIEHRILRPIWQDPRIHYGVNCASIGCPNLQPQPFTAANTDRLLEKGAREYVNHPRGARIEDNRLIASSIYHWFIEDFGGDGQGVIAHLKRYAVPDFKARLEGFNRITDHEYDWSLNDIRR